MGRLAIVLSGGGAKGAFQVGVLDALITEKGVRPKIVVGTSTGAIQAMAVAQQDVPQLVEMWSGLTGERDIYTNKGDKVVSVLLGKSSLNNAAPLRKILTGLCKPDRIKASGIELRLGVVSLRSGEFRTIDQHCPNLSDWVYASCAMPVFFDPLKTSDGDQWVDGGVREVTPLGEALKLKPSGVLVIRASPSRPMSAASPCNGIMSIGLRAVSIQQSEVSRNDIANTTLINDMLAARESLFARMERAGIGAAQANDLLKPLDDQLAGYHFAQIRTIEPEEEFSDTLEFHPEKIGRAMAAGREAVHRHWAMIEPLTR